MSGPAPIEGGIFDYHHTLVHGGDPARWVAEAWARLERPGSPAEALGEGYAALLDFLDHVWVHALVVDPAGERDLRVAAHHRVFLDTLEQARSGSVGPALDPAWSEALYATMTDQWTAYDDSIPTLTALRERGVRTAILSNMGLPVASVLERQGLDQLVDAVVLSYEIGIVKPAPGAFAVALERLGLPAERVLMVGDSHRDDVGAAALGIRTLVLPRTAGPVHGLGLVTRLIG